MASTPVSPKVHAAGMSVAAVTLVMYLLDQIPAVASMPVSAKGAVLVLVNLGVGYLAGWLATDPLRNLGAKFDNNPATAPTKRNEAGQVVVDVVQLGILITLVLILLFGTGLAR